MLQKLVRKSIFISRGFCLLFALLLLVVGCSRWGNEAEETARLERDSLSLLAEKQAVERKNRQLKLDMKLSEQESLYALIYLHDRRIQFKMKGVPLKDWEIRSVVVRPGSEGEGGDQWLEQPLTILDKREVIPRNMNGSEERRWSEVTISAHADQDTVTGRAVWDTTVGPYSISKKAFIVVPDSSLPTSYDLYTDHDVVVSVRTEKDISGVPRGFSSWVTTISDVIREVMVRLTGQPVSDYVQIVLDERDVRAIFRSLQVGMRLILVP